MTSSRDERFDEMIESDLSALYAAEVPDLRFAPQPMVDAASRWATRPTWPLATRFGEHWRRGRSGRRVRRDSVARRRDAARQRRASERMNRREALRRPMPH